MSLVPDKTRAIPSWKGRRPRVMLLGSQSKAGISAAAEDLQTLIKPHADITLVDLNGTACLDDSDKGDIRPACADSCRSYIKFENLYQQFLVSTNNYNTLHAEFFKKRVINLGAHTRMRR